ncbi:MAG: redoxin domain-containing protein [Terriglobia bacterium]|jgi:peroxiredoxin
MATWVALLVLFCLMGIGRPAPAADGPLTADDVRLLLIGGAAPAKMVALIEQRGISFTLTEDLEKKFRSDGADDAVLQALRKAQNKPAAAPPETPASSERAQPESRPAPAERSEPAAKEKSAPGGYSSEREAAESASARAGADEPVLHRRSANTEPSVSQAAPSPSPATSQEANGPILKTRATADSSSTAATSAGSSSTAPTSAGSSPTEKKIADVLGGLANPSGEAGTRVDDRPLAPTFTLKDLAGHRLSLDDYKGKVVLLDFWATWCPQCRKEIPAFIRLQNQYHERGFQVIGVSVDNSSRPVRKFYEDYMMNYPVAMCDDFTRRIYGGLHGVPTTLLIGRDGRIEAKMVGAPDDMEAFLDGFEAQLKRLLAPPPGNGVMAAGPAVTKPTLVASASAAPTPVGAAASSTASSESAGPAPAAPLTLAKAAPAAPKAAAPDLSDPAPGEVQNIIREFTAKEKLFKEARNNYTYHQSNKVETLDPDGNVDGAYEQEWDILFDDSGKRIERVTYAPLDTLKRISMTAEDLDAFRNIQPFVLTSDELPEYEVKYLGHVKVDEITAYVFSVRPKELEKGRQYFQGVVWVDDRDLQIVKSEGKNVPELKTKKGENLFPRFTTYREQIDGKYWFPTFTMADDNLYFSSGSVHIKEIVRYSEYKQFKSKTRIISVTPTDEPGTKPATPPKEKH